MTQPPSQPPPPGQQPGYGYPQGPPQGEPGYGYPQQTPPAPGQPPAQPGPYNQPGPYGQQPGQPGPYAQQPGPYGQQPGPYNQPGPYGSQPNPYGGGSGYPPQQFPGAPTPPPGGSGGGNFFQGKPGVVIAAAVAGLLVIGGGTWFALSGDDSGGGKKNVSKDKDAKPTGESVPDEGDGTGGGREAQDDLNAGRKDGESKVLWLQKNDVDLPKNGADVQGPWFAGDVVAKAMYKKMVGYGAADGKQKWSLTLPAEVCASPSLPTADGKIVIAIKDGVSEKADCTVLQQVDLKTGKGGWKQEVKEADNWDFLSDITLAINGDTVTAARTGHVNAYRMSDGKELFDEVPGDCQPSAISSGPRMIAAESCPGGDVDKQQNQVQELDPATGKARWTYKLKTNWELDKVYSSDPIVLSLTEPDKKTWAIVALNANGTLRSQIDGGKDKFQPNCGGSFIVFGANLDGCTGVAADADTFYMSTQPSETGSNGTNEVIAFNLATGKAKWRAKAPSARVMTPLRMEGANVVVYYEPSYDKGGAVATLAPTGGSPKVVLQNPESTSEIENSFYDSELDYVDGRFFVTSSRVSASDDKAEMETKTMMAFGK
ncbi:outer membrane protein assembly factor BamB family protein [Streptomyces sp. NBC_01716]|uniref:outer membrane protein assembly factor BamB family protein n=1 Tax=Streptomyces sp. NBC_01716 TaxID=2975917 RepID=UPI002E315562|nr:PQQ-binding-like beta-propeller repeat protein [Streptomyces sp. NBC_01716]